MLASRAMNGMKLTRIAASFAALSVILATSLAPARERHRRHARTNDPLLAAIIEHESHGVAGVVGGRDGQCIGLTQICLHDVAECKGGFETPECLARKTALLDPNENLRVARGTIATWRKYCREATGHGDVRAIVFGFAGANGKGNTCGMRQNKRGRWAPVKTPEVVQAILDLYEENLGHRVPARRTKKRARGTRR